MNARARAGSPLFVSRAVGNADREWTKARDECQFPFQQSFRKASLNQRASFNEAPPKIIDQSKARSEVSIVVLFEKRSKQSICCTIGLFIFILLVVAFSYIKVVIP